MLLFGILRFFLAIFISYLDTCYLAYCKKGTREAMFLNFPRENIFLNFPWEIIFLNFPWEIIFLNFPWEI